jgi:glycosyltransferase involved in cell wall biosynthesis
VGARTPSVLVVAPEPVGPSAIGPARRAAKLAEVVGAECEVTLAAPSPSTFPEGPYRTLDTGPVDDQRLAGAFARHDVTVVQALPSPRQLLAAIRRCRHLVVDMIAPLAFEAAQAPGQGPAQRRATAGWRVRQLADHLRAADLVLCTNERQRDLFIGAATVAGGAVPLAERFAVVPHGIDEDPPRPSSRPLRDAGLVSTGDKLAVWGGGLWGWLDPLTPIRAVERLRERRPEVRLALVGTGRGAGPAVGAGEEAIAYVRDRALEGEAVIFGPDWLEREAYLDHVLEADAAVTAHLDSLEARYATRTRVLDYLWAGLPVACTSGDPMADFVEANGLGATAAPGDVDGFAAALDRALSTELPRGPADAALAPLLWRNAAAPLVEYCRDPGALPPRRRGRAAADALRNYGSFLASVYRGDGAGAVARAAARRVRRG